MKDRKLNCINNTYEPHQKWQVKTWLKDLLSRIKAGWSSRCKEKCQSNTCSSTSSSQNNTVIKSWRTLSSGEKRKRASPYFKWLDFQSICISWRLNYSWLTSVVVILILSTDQQSKGIVSNDIDIWIMNLVTCLFDECQRLWLSTSWKMKALPNIKPLCLHIVDCCIDYELKSVHNSKSSMMMYVIVEKCHLLLVVYRSNKHECLYSSLTTLYL